MPAAASLSEDSVAAVPASGGIYRLYRDGEVVYAGMALASLRCELESHRRGERGECTRTASGFLCEVTAHPERALREYLLTYMAHNGARLPRCNPPPPWRTGEEAKWNSRDRLFGR